MSGKTSRKYSGATPDAAPAPAARGAWADAADGQPSNAAAAIEAAASAEQSGMGVGSTPHKAPGSISKAGGKTPTGAANLGSSAIDVAALKSLLDETIQSAVKPLHEQIGALRERVDLSDAIAESRRVSSGDESDGASDASSGGDSEVDAILSDEKVYVGFDSTNPHFNSAELSAGQKFKPARRDLWGQRAWMSLTKNGDDPNGALASSLSYAEPLSLYGYALHERLDDLCERFADGEDPHSILTDLVAARNSSRELYRLANIHRSIIVQKARALRPGADAYEKAEVKYLEGQLEHRDFESADVADAVQELKDKFRKRSSKASFEKLAKQGSKAGHGGGVREHYPSCD